MKKLLLILLLLLFGGDYFGTNHHHKIRQEVLGKSVVGEMFIYGEWTKEGDEETHLKYLGQFTTTDGRIFKVITSSWYWGLSKRATSRILIFNEKNQYVGNYYVGVVKDLPYKLEDSELKFYRRHCNDTRTFYADFKNGLSVRFFVGCSGEKGHIGTDGDFYSFNS